MEYCWASSWSCDSKPTLPQKTILKQVSVVELAISKLFTSFWGEKVSKLSFFLGCGRVWDVLTPMPDLRQTDSWTRWFTKSAAKTRLYFFFLLESSDIPKKAVEHGKWGFHSSVTSFVLPVFETYLRHSMFFFPIPKGLSKVRRHLFWWTRLTGSQKSRGFLPEIKKEINEKKRPKFQWASQMLLANWQNIPIQLRHPPSPNKNSLVGTCFMLGQVSGKQMDF